MKIPARPIEQEYVEELCRFCIYNKICSHNLFYKFIQTEVSGGMLYDSVSVQCLKYKYINLEDKEENKVWISEEV